MVDGLVLRGTTWSEQNFWPQPEKLYTIHVNKTSESEQIPFSGLSTETIASNFKNIACFQPFYTSVLYDCLMLIVKKLPDMYLFTQGQGYKTNANYQAEKQKGTNLSGKYQDAPREDNLLHDN